MPDQDELSSQTKTTEDSQIHAVDWAPRKPYAALFSLIAWAGVVAGIAGFWIGSDQGWMDGGMAPFVLIGVGGLIALVAGIITTTRGLKFQGALQIVSGLVLLALPVLLILAVGGAYSSMAGGG